jgi:hypothetical protein
MQFNIIALAYALAAGITAMPADTSSALDTIIDDYGHRFEGKFNVRNSITFDSHLGYRIHLLSFLDPCTTKTCSHLMLVFYLPKPNNHRALLSHATQSGVTVTVVATAVAVEAVVAVEATVVAVEATVVVVEATVVVVEATVVAVVVAVEATVVAVEVAVEATVVAVEVAVEATVVAVEAAVVAVEAAVVAVEATVVAVEVTDAADAMMSTTTGARGSAITTTTTTTITTELTLVTPKPATTSVSDGTRLTRTVAHMIGGVAAGDTAATVATADVGNASQAPTGTSVGTISEGMKTLGRAEGYGPGHMSV